MASQNKVRSFYQTVIEEVISNVRDSFQDEGLDDQALQDFKATWEAKLNHSKAVEPVEHSGPFVKHQQLMAHKAAGVPAGAYIQAPIPHRTHIATMPATHGTPFLYNHTSGQIEMSSAASTGQMAALTSFIKSNVMPVVGGNQMQILLPAPGLTLPQQLQVAPRVNTSQSRVHQGQLDGANDESSSDDDADDDDDDDNDKDDKDEHDDDNEEGVEEEPLNSEDDCSEGNPSDLFEVDNVVVCQFDKINRTRNKWRFILKDGIMNLNGKDYLFQKATGDADW